MINLHKITDCSYDLMLLQKKIFLPIYLKYFDKHNPIFESRKIMQYRLRNKNTKAYYVVYEEKKESFKTVGYVILRFNNNTATIGRIGVLNKYQNKGIGTLVIEELEKRFSNYKIWQLDTIKEEKRNCHLYEKLGYIPTGEERKINKRMTILNYEKRLERL